MIEIKLYVHFKGSFHENHGHLYVAVVGYLSLETRLMDFSLCTYRPYRKRCKYLEQAYPYQNRAIE